MDKVAPITAGTGSRCLDLSIGLCLGVLGGCAAVGPDFAAPPVHVAEHRGHSFG